MAWMEAFSFTAAMVSLGLSLVFTLVLIVMKRLRPVMSAEQPAISSPGLEKWRFVPLGLTSLGLLSLTLAIIGRAIVTGHGPFSNMYEFLLAFAWGILAMSLFFQLRYRLQIVVTFGDVFALGLLLFASTLPSKPVPLVPALQQSFLLSAHVAAAMVAYGAFTVGFGTSILYLIKERWHGSGLPALKVLDDMSYTAAKIGFPFMTLLIILGALWADIAWGSYWSWDPKETASLVTWLLFAGYLHARVIQGWRGKRTAVIFIIGFGAVLFTFFGNYFFSGLHSYR